MDGTEHLILNITNSIYKHFYTEEMKTLSIQKNKTVSVFEGANKWWNTKNAFFSMLTGEKFSNREVVLTHLILMAFCAGIACAETLPSVSILAIAISAVCVRFLNQKKNNANITD